MAKQIEKRRVVLMAIQTARGTPTTLLPASHYIEASAVGNPVEKPINVENPEFNGLDTLSAPDKLDPLWEFGEMTVPVRLGTAAGDALPIGTALKAAGFAETLNAGVDAVYQWASVDPSLREVMSITQYDGAEKYDIMDAVCMSCSLMGEVGKPVDFKFSPGGIANGVTPAAATFPASVTASTTQKRLLMSAASSLTIDTVARPLRSFEITPTIDAKEFYNTVQGRGNEVLGWNPSFKVTVKAEPGSADHATFRAGTTINLELDFGTGRVLNIAMAIGAINDITPSYVEGVKHHEITGSLHGGDQAIVITAP